MTLFFLLLSYQSAHPCPPSLSHFHPLPTSLICSIKRSTSDHPHSTQHSIARMLDVISTEPQRYIPMFGLSGLGFQLQG